MLGSAEQLSSWEPPWSFLRWSDSWKLRQKSVPQIKCAWGFLMTREMETFTLYKGGVCSIRKITRKVTCTIPPHSTLSKRIEAQAHTHTNIQTNIHMHAYTPCTYSQMHANKLTYTQYTHIESHSYSHKKGTSPFLQNNLMFWGKLF